MRLANDNKVTFQVLHTYDVNKAVKNPERNAVLDDRPLPIHNSEDLTRKLLVSYKNRIRKDARLNVC